MLVVSGKREMIAIGLVLVVILIFMSFLVSFRFIYIAYSIYLVFILFTYVILWNERPLSRSEPEQPKMDKWPSVSVLIPSYNSRHTILKCIEHCKNLEYPGKKEVIVIDDGSSDGSYELFSEDKSITVLRKDRNAGKGAALNWGIKRASGDIIACVDSDTYPCSDVLVNAVPKFSKHVSAVVLFIRTVKPRNLLQKLQEIEYWVSFGFFFKSVSEAESMYVIPGPMSLYRRDVFQELGGFDEHNITEDMEIALRMQKNGWKIRYCGSAVVETEVPMELGSLFRQRVRWYRGGLMNLLKYSELIFNRKYNNLGVFMLPIILTSGIFGAMFMLWTLFEVLKSWMLGFQPWFANFGATASLGLVITPLDVFMVDSNIVFGVISIFLWLYFMVTGFRLAKQKIGLSYVPQILLMMTLYPIFIGVVYVIAYTYEFLGRDYKW